MITSTTLKTAERKFSVYFQINNDNPLTIADLEFSTYIKLKHSPENATNYILKLVKDGKVKLANEKITIIYFSLDGVDFKPIYEDEANNNNANVKDLANDLNTNNKNENLNNNNISSSTSTYKIKGSPVWKYFKKINNHKARCQICSNIYKSGGNTTNLSQHLSRKHPIQYSVEKNDEQSCTSTNVTNCKSGLSNTVNTKPKFDEQITSAFEKINSFSKGGSTTETITNKIMYMILVDYCPINIVEKKGFRSLMKSVVPLYKVPSRKTITNLLDFTYEQKKERFIDNMSEVMNITLTCDIWSDISNKSYLSLTIHYLDTTKNEMKNGTLCASPLEESHTSDYLVEIIKANLDSFKICHERINTIITDNGANIKKAAILLFGPQKHLSCIAHLFSHIVPDALKEIPSLQNIIAKVKAIVTLTKRSTSVSDELIRLQVRDGKTEDTALKFKQDVPTRWNSTYYMLERFLILKDYVYPISLKCPNIPDMLNREELQILEDAIQFLQPIEKAIREVSGETYCTSSLVIPLIRCLKLSLQKRTAETEIGSSLKIKLLKAIECRFQDHEKNLILSISTILDPRFKRLHFEHASTATTTITQIDKILKSCTSREIKKLDKCQLKTAQIAHDLWQFHDELVSQDIHVENECYGINIDIKQYLQQPVIDRHQDPFIHWQTLIHAYPNLYPVAMKYLSIVVTSVPSERLFSKAGAIKNENRSRLTGKRLNKLLFLSSLDENY
ncbi:E3 SUMO-protein ligase ZBED1-like, partial [Prorops nasuta]